MNSSNYQAVIIFLHWLNCKWEKEEVINLVKGIFDDLPYNTKFSFPQAPTIFVDYDNEEKSSWYNIISPDDLENGKNDRGLFNSIKKIEEIIEREINEGIPSENIFVIGFSQGGSLALSIAMTSRYKLGSFLVLGGFIPYHKFLKTIEKENNKNTPIFMFHGEDDKTILYEKAQQSQQILKNDGYNIKIKGFSNVEHAPNSLMIDENINLLKNIFETRKFTKIDTFNKDNVEIVEIKQKP